MTLGKEWQLVNTKVATSKWQLASTSVAIGKDLIGKHLSDNWQTPLANPYGHSGAPTNVAATVISFKNPNFFQIASLLTQTHKQHLLNTTFSIRLCLKNSQLFVKRKKTAISKVSVKYYNTSILTKINCQMQKKRKMITYTLIHIQNHYTKTCKTSSPDPTSRKIFTNLRM